MIFIVSIPISVVGKMSEKSATTITQLITSNNTRDVNNISFNFLGCSTTLHTYMIHNSLQLRDNQLVSEFPWKIKKNRQTGKAFDLGSTLSVSPIVCNGRRSIATSFTDEVIFQFTTMTIHGRNMVVIDTVLGTGIAACR